MLMAEQRLPKVNQDDGVWGDILRQYLMKEHTNDDTNNPANGGHRHITITSSDGSTGTAPIKFTSGTLLTTPEVGAMEFAGDNLYLTQTSGTIRKKVALYDDTSGATGDIYYRNSAGYFTRLGAGSTGDILTIASGIPSWTSTIVGKALGNTNTIVVKDANFTLQDDEDTSKQAKFQLSSLDTGQTRIYNLPDTGELGETWLVGHDLAQTLTNKTLADPKANAFMDTAGNMQFTTSPTDMSMSVDLNMQGNYVWNLHDPVDPLDAATKEYVDVSTGALPRADGNLVIGGDFQTDSQWANAMGSQTTEQAVFTGGKSHQIVSTGAGSGTDYFSLTHDGTGTPVTIPVIGERRYVIQAWLLKKNTNVGGGNVVLQSFLTKWDDTTQTIDSLISASTISNSIWDYWEYTHSLTAANFKSIQFRICLDNTVPSGDTFYVGGAVVTDITGSVSPYVSQTLTNKTLNADNNTITNIEIDNFKATAVVTEAEGISSNDNDTTLPTSAAVKDYVDSASAGSHAPRVSTIASSATPSINVSTTDQFNIAALATNITSVSISGTPADGQKLMIRIKDDGTTRTITWGSSFQSSGIASLLASTAASKTHHVGLIYDASVAKWVCIAADVVGY